jgi:sirohydrochlorin cobaltochelatase
MRIFSTFHLNHILPFLISFGVMMHTSATSAQKNDSQLDKTAIVLVAFGSTAAQTIQTYEKIEKSFKKAFPQYPISWAYTSEIVIKKLSTNGKQIKNVNESIKQLQQNGFSSIVLQSLHIMPGEEYLSIDTTGFSATIEIGEPLLACETDIRNVAQIITPMCKGNCPTVIAAHGNGKYPELNKPIHELATIIEQQCSRTVLCTIEGEPGILPLQKIAIAAKTQGCATFIPLMLISGVHVQEDLGGPDSTSWKNRLNISNVTITPPLGEITAIHDIFISHCRNALKKLEEK